MRFVLALVMSVAVLTLGACDGDEDCVEVKDGFGYVQEEVCDVDGDGSLDPYL